MTLIYVATCKIVSFACFGFCVYSFSFSSITPVRLLVRECIMVLRSGENVAYWEGFV
jgi:hypothetical protein